MSVETGEPQQPEQPQTASCAIPLIVLGIVLVLLVIAFPISRALIGGPMRQMEDVAGEVAVKYIRDSRGADTDFGKRMDEAVGEYKSSRVIKLGAEKSDPPKVYVTLVVTGSKGEGVATIEILAKSGGGYDVSDALIVPR